MDVRDLRELLTPEGLRLLDEVSASSNKTNLVAEVSRLRKSGVSPGLVATVITQARLRSRARVKFSDFADHMLFTPAGLEQATRLRVAAHHASRFARAGFARVGDLGCGIGADSMALASLDLTVQAFDIDELTAAIASFNLAPFPSCSVEHADVRKADLSGLDALWFDPARRASGHSSTQRLANPRDWTPALDWVLEKASERPSGIKLGPGFPLVSVPSMLGDEPVEAQWVDVGGETVELVLWTKELARPGVRRSALVLGKQDEDLGFHELVGAEGVNDQVANPPIGPISAFIYEPHGAVIRARLMGDLAERLGAHALDDRIAYLSGEDFVATPFADAFEVDEVLSIDTKKISVALASRDIGNLEIKKRGVDVDPHAFRRKLTLSGGGDATLILTRLGSGSTSTRHAVLCRRVSSHRRQLPSR